jgi:poly(A) polymerase Pap1
MATVTGIRVISRDGPTPTEIKHSQILDLWCENTIEPEEETERRSNALELLRTVCKQWIHQCYVDEFNLPASDDVGGRIFTTGSYRYNAHSSGSDIDVVLIAPEKLTLAHFTSRLPNILKQSPHVTDMVVIAEARVPLITMRIYGIDFDLSFGSVGRPRVPDDINMLDDRILIGLTPQSTKAANAVRVADLLIKSVPNVAVFRQVLRFIKVWAKARGVYSFKIGYPSGIGWAILCAKICQCYPNKNGAGTIFHFFAFYASWFRRNPTPREPNRAIFLTASHTPAIDLRREGVEPSWNPQERMKDARALFPVLTPAYPYQDSCDNVSMTTLGALCDEFKRAHEIVRTMKDNTLDQIPELEKILKKAIAEKKEAERECANPNDAYERGKEVMKGISFGALWETLLEKYPFFITYTHFVRIAISATHPREYRPWVEMMEAKICSLWKEQGKWNKGVALECWAPHLQLRPISTTYEEPSQSEILSQSKKDLQQAEASGNNTAAQNIINGRVFTAYAFIGITLLPGAKLATPQDPNNGINFAKSISAFVDRCRDSQAKFTTARAPVVDIVKRADLPRWLPGTMSEEEIAKMNEEKAKRLQEEEERKQHQQQNHVLAGGTSSSSASLEGGIIRSRDHADEEELKREQKEAEMKRQQILQLEMTKRENEEKQRKQEQEAKEREAERQRQLLLEQQKKQQTEVESMMGFDF